MKGSFVEEELMFRNIVEILTQKKIEKIKSVTVVYGEKRKESILIDFFCDGKEETFAVCPQK